MAKFLQRSLGTTAAIAASLTLASAVSAQEPPASTSADIPSSINEIFYGNSGPYSSNRTVWRYGDFFLGIGGFPEREVLRDSDAINKATVYLLDLQATVDPTIRVPDLFNPYETSVQFLPTTRDNIGVFGGEFIFEPAPTP